MGSESRKFHAVCQLFPAMTDEELDALVEDIRANGQRDPIITWKDEVIEGRHRLAACRLAGVEPKFAEWDGKGSMIAFVASKNLHRRHLTESQRAVIGLRLREEMEREPAIEPEPEVAAQTPTGDLNDGPSRNPPPSKPAKKKAAKLKKPNGRPPRKTKEAAKAAGTTTRAIQRAAAVEAAAPEMIEAVQAGEMSLAAAEEQIAERNAPHEPETIDPVALVRTNIHATLKAVIRDVRKIPDIDHKAFVEHIGQAGKVLDGNLSPVQPNPTPDAVLTFPCAGKPASWVLTESQVAEWMELYPAVDVVAECRKALGWIRSNTKKTAKGMPRFLTSWLGRAQDSGKASRTTGGGRDKLSGLNAFVESERRRRGPSTELLEGGGNETPF